MSTVNSLSSGVSDVLQLLSTTGLSSASSALASSGLQSALGSASSKDLVVLGSEALRFQETAGLFGSSSDSSQTDTALASLEQAVNSSITGSTTASSTSTSTTSTASAAAAYAQQEVASLLGTTTSGGILA